MGVIYKVGSFNTHNLSLGTNRDIERIANMIKQNHLDIVALQEVLSDGRRITGSTDSPNKIVQTEMLKRSLMYHLGSNWACRVEKPDNHQTSKYPYPYLGEDRREEAYAFVWNTDRIELPVINRKIVYPKIENNYHLREQGLLRLIRDPLVGRFRVKDRKVEIRLITTHIINGKPKAKNLAEPIDFGALSMRRNEFKVLAGDIYAHVNDHCREMESIVPYTIILGDYNLNLQESGIMKYTLEKEIMYYDKKGISITDPTKADRAIYTVQHDLTTLQRDRDGYASNFDHFSFEERVKKDIFRRCYAIDAVHGTTTMMSPKSYMMATQQPSGPDSPFGIYLKDVSDHLPIVIELDF